MLALRSALSTLIGLYTSRVVLATLGVEDYGLYAVAGSVIGMLGFLTGSLSGATSRFITYEMGRGNLDALKKMFSSTLTIHITLALIVVLIGETIGLWFLETKLNIAPDRMNAARWVYHLSVASFAIGVTQTPYSAFIIAYERMGIYAYFELLSSVLRLLNVYLLMIVDSDKLVLYAVLGFAVGVLMLVINRAYCLYHFQECRSLPTFDRQLTRRMFGYAGLNMISVFCVSLCFQGTTYLLNIFFGVIANAAVSIAATVHGITMQFGANVQSAFRPQITKQYAAGKIFTMAELTSMSARFTVLVMASMVVPCIIEAPLILKLWLGNIPPMSVEFLRCMLAIGWLGCISNTLDSVVYSTGKLKLLTINKSLLFSLNILSIYLLFKSGAPAYSAYIANGIMYVGLTASVLCVIKHLVPDFNPIKFITNTLKVLLTAITAALPLTIICLCLESSLLRLTVIIAAYLTSLSIISWHLVLNTDEKSRVKAVVHEKLSILHDALCFKQTA